MTCERCAQYSDELRTVRAQLAQAEVVISYWKDRAGKYVTATEALWRLVADLDACSRHPAVDLSANARLKLSLRDVHQAMQALGLSVEVSYPITVVGGNTK